MSITRCAPRMQDGAIEGQLNRKASFWSTPWAFVAAWGGSSRRGACHAVVSIQSMDWWLHASLDRRRKQPGRGEGYEWVTLRCCWTEVSWISVLPGDSVRQDSAHLLVVRPDRGQLRMAQYVDRTVIAPAWNSMRSEAGVFGRPVSRWFGWGSDSGWNSFYHLLVFEALFLLRGDVTFPAALRPFNFTFTGIATLHSSVFLLQTGLFVLLTNGRSKALFRLFLSRLKTLQT